MIILGVPGMLRHKSNLIGLRNLKRQVEKKFECKIKVFRSDSGGEYVSTEFKRFLSSNEIIH